MAPFMEEPQDVGIEVVGVPHGRKKRSRESSRHKELPSSPRPRPVQQRPSSPPTVINNPDLPPELQAPLPHPTRRNKTAHPRPKHKAGEILKPPAETNLHPKIRPKIRKVADANPTQPVTYIEGDPAPPCFRVVGVEDEKKKSSNRPSMLSYYSCQFDNTASTSTYDKDAINESILTDEADDDEASLQLQTAKQKFLQLDVENMAADTAAAAAGRQQPAQPSKTKQQPKRREIFEDETPSLLDLDDTSSCGDNNSRDHSTALSITDSSRCSGYSRQDYLKLTQELMQQRKRELKRQQRNQKALGRRNNNNDAIWKDGDATTTAIQYYGRWAMGMAVVVGIGLALVVTMMIVKSKDRGVTTAAAAALNGNDSSLTMPPGAELYDTISLKDLPPSTQQIIATNRESPQAKAFQWLSDDPILPSYPKWRQIQRMALAALYFSTHGEHWKHANKWLQYDSSECQWYPQACDSNDKIRRLLLSDSNLDGTLPPELFWLTDLQQVQLHDNPLLRGTIPAEIRSWTELQVLWMQRCALTGLPTEIGTLTQLLYLDLSENPLGRLNVTASGQVASSARDPYSTTPAQETFYQDLPTELGQLTRLQELILSQAHLMGSIPSELGQLTALQYSLQLQGNGLRGTLPTEVGQWQQLEQFYASENDLSGSLPTQIGRWSKLQVLDLSVNHLEGTLPMYISLCESLQEIWLYDNLMSGAIPEQIGYLAPTLVSLDLSMNQFQSTLPPQLGQLTELTGLWLYQNLLTGFIPTALGDLHAKLLQLSLFSNSLAGSIPSELSRLSQLRGMWLDQNKLTGLIPRDLLESTSLVALHLFDNLLQGRIPNSISDKSILKELRLELNRLSATIPTLIGYLNNLQVLELHDNRFNGPIPTELAELSLLNSLSLHNNNLSGSVPRGVCANKDTSVDFERISVDCNRIDCSCGCQCPTN